MFCSILASKFCFLVYLFLFTFFAAWPLNMLAYLQHIRMQCSSHLYLCSSVIFITTSVFINVHLKNCITGSQMSAML
jgi:hypothetical protein